MACVTTTGRGHGRARGPRARACRPHRAPSPPLAAGADALRISPPCPPPCSTPNTVWYSNLADSATEEESKAFFAKAGAVKSVEWGQRKR